MKDKKSLLILCVIILMLLSGFLGYQLKDFISPNKEVEKTQTTETKEDEDENANEEIAKERIHHIIKIGTYTTSGGYDKISRELYKGKSEITREEKLQMTYIGTLKERKSVEEIPEKYKDDEKFKAHSMYSDRVPMVLEQEIESFNKEYNYLFNEEIGEYSADEISGCPHAYIIDRELGKIYYHHDCGGTGAPKLITEIVKEEKIDNQYLVTVKEAYKYPDEEAPREAKEIIWKFDKDGYFISTTVNE